MMQSLTTVAVIGSLLTGGPATGSDDCWPSFFPLGVPSHELTQDIDLIVVAAVGEVEKLEGADLPTALGHGVAGQIIQVQ
jgi:hypothetical protein